MKRIIVLIGIVFIINLVVICTLFDISINNKMYLNLKYKSLDKKIVYLGYPKRGRILDKNGNVLVDNKSVKTLFLSDSNIDIIEYSNLLSNVLNMESNDIEDNIKNGYKYEDKIIKVGLNNEDIDEINKLRLDKLYIGDLYERVYIYDSSINQLFGDIGYIQKESINEYLNKGYSRNDLVGVSFLEKYYESYLKGVKDKYEIDDNGNKKLIEKGRDGFDLVLNIDINVQLKIDDILKSEMKKVKSYPSGKYYNGSYVIVSDVDGGILSISSYNYNDGKFDYNTVGALTNSYTVGSVVKGASQSVAFINNVINTKEYINDSCIKLYSQNKKCSWTNLGRINDIDALAMSSNYYQFFNAIKVSGYNYKYNMKFNPKIEDFNKYRNVFDNYGLGSYTGIDLNEEKLGIKGNNISGDLLLNLSIGQYDAYTPVMLNNYIATLANNGNRYKLRLAKSIIDNNEELIINSSKVIDKVNIKENDINRVKMGLNAVMRRGTGSSYNNTNINSAGKTGTAETFYNGEKTLTKSFVMFIPYDEPKYAISIISPHLSYQNSINNYRYPINTLLSRKIVHILFEK